MNILFVCNKSPYPANEGGPIAMNMFIEGLVDQGHEVKVLAVSSDKYSVSKDDIPDDYLKKTQLETVFVDLKLKPFGAFNAFISNKSYHIERFISNKFKNKLEEILLKNEYDIVQFESIFVAPYIDVVRKNSNAKIILRAHNVEHQIWEGIAKNTTNPLKKFYLKHLSRTLKEYELTSISKFDGIVCISQNDADYFQSLKSKTPITDISFGVQLSKFSNHISETEPYTIFHLGAMNWIPNLQGIEWFLENVWPEITKQNSKLKLYLAGHKMPDELRSINDTKIIVEGFIDDPIEYISSKSIMVVPLFSSSGVRIKIIEGMAAGKTIISTTKGAQGIYYSNNENILIADTKEAFVEQINKCLMNEDFCKKIGQNAKQLISKKHNADDLIKKLISFYTTSLSSANNS